MPGASFAPVTSMKRGSGKQQKRSNRAGVRVLLAGLMSATASLSKAGVQKLPTGSEKLIAFSAMLD
jgi:hypothetical protein